CSRGIYR
nr:immunoglobulin heavy chain junction region [Macaca mulatta]